MKYFWQFYFASARILHFKTIALASLIKVNNNLSLADSQHKNDNIIKKI